MIETARLRLSDVDVDVVTLADGACSAVLTNLGARLIELHVPDRAGTLADIVLQRPSLTDMSTDDSYMGSTAGRYANRIRDGRLLIDGVPVQLSVNEGRHHLHGGQRGFDRCLWSTQLGADGNEVTFWRLSPSGEEGYPGTLTTSVTYRLENARLGIDIRATTDAPTVVNIVNHSYFNLGGHASGTPFDFRTSTPIGKHLADVGHSGYDHNWVLDGVDMRDVVVVTDPASGRRLSMSTNQVGVQLYVGGHLDGVTGKSPVGRYPAFAGFTLETQTFPDAVNHPHFPRAELRPGDTYHNAVGFTFSTT